MLSKYQRRRNPLRWNMVNEADGKLDVLEYHMRRYCDTDDVGAFGKEQPSDD